MSLPADGGARDARARRLLLLLVLAGAGLRLPRLFDDFWFDEIWAFILAQQLGSAAAIPSAYLSVNHHLYTLLLQWMGAAPWPLLRLPSFLASVLTLGLAWRLARTWGRAAGLISVLLFATSHLLIQYDTEARGYALSIAFALGAAICAQRYASSDRLYWAVLLWLLVALGFSAHLLFIHALNGLGLYFVVRALAPGEQRRMHARQALVALGVPGALLVVLYVSLIRKFTLGEGSGAPADIAGVVIESLSRAGGGVAHGPIAIVSALLVAAAIGLVAVRLWRMHPPFAALVAGAGVLSPLLMLIANPTEWLLPRYFVMSLAFVLLGAGVALGTAFERGGRARVFVCAVLALYLAGNAAQLARAYRDGRGHYTEAIADMLRTPGSAPLALASPQSKWTLFVLSYYQPLLDPHARLHYVPLNEIGAQGADWVVVGDQLDEPKPAARIGDRHGNAYELYRVYRSGPLSGMNWSLYRRARGR